jgi:hypothetical protein
VYNDLHRCHATQDITVINKARRIRWTGHSVGTGRRERHIAAYRPVAETTQ